MRLIDADKIFPWYVENFKDINPNDIRFSMNDIRGNLDNIESVELTTKPGHWILDETDNSITCDKCGCLIWANDIHNGEAYYCPNCGSYNGGD